MKHGVRVTVTLNPEVERLLRGLALFNDRSSHDHIVSRAIRAAAKDKDFQKWLVENSSALDGEAEQKAGKKSKLGPARAA